MKDLKDKINLQLLTLLLTIAVSYWFWRLIFFDLLIAVTLFLLTIFLHRYIFYKSNLKIVILLFVIASVLTLQSGFDTSFKSANKEIKLNERHKYYYEYFGKLYANRIGTYVYNNILPIWNKFEKNAFSPLDLNLYFFNSHPRERAGVEEFKKYSFLFIPFFLLGLVSLITKRTKAILVYLGAAALTSGFIASNYRLGPVLFFPLMNLFIAYGAIIVFSKISMFKYKN